VQELRRKQILRVSLLIQTNNEKWSRSHIIHRLFIETNYLLTFRVRFRLSLNNGVQWGTAFLKFWTVLIQLIAPGSSQSRCARQPLRSHLWMKSQFDLGLLQQAGFDLESRTSIKAWKTTSQAKESSLQTTSFKIIAENKFRTNLPELSRTVRHWWIAMRSFIEQWTKGYLNPRKNKTAKIHIFRKQHQQELKSQ